MIHHFIIATLIIAFTVLLANADSTTTTAVTTSNATTTTISTAATTTANKYPYVTRFWFDGSRKPISDFLRRELDWERTYWPHNAKVVVSLKSTPDSVTVSKQMKDHQLFTQISELQELTNKVSLYSAFHNNNACLDELCAQTYILLNETECNLFLERLEHESNSQTVWILKHGKMSKNRGLVIFPNAKSLAQQIDHRGGCPKIYDQIIAQPYITNPLLTDRGHKLSFQIHVLIANLNPLMVLYHPNPIVWIAEKPFQLSNWEDKAIHFANSRVRNRKNRVFTMEHLFSTGYPNDHFYKSKLNETKFISRSLKTLFKHLIVHTINTTKHIFDKAAVPEYEYDYYDSEDIYHNYHRFRYGKSPVYKKPKHRIHLLAFDYIILNDDLEPILIDIQRVPATAFRSNDKNVAEVFHDVYKEMMNIGLELLDWNGTSDLVSVKQFEWLVNESYDPPYYSSYDYDRGL